MPKIKTNKSAAKRLYKTGKGKIMRNKAYKRHLMKNKSPKQKRGYDGKAPVFAGDVWRIKKLIPYA